MGARSEGRIVDPRQVLPRDIPHEGWLAHYSGDSNLVALDLYRYIPGGLHVDHVRNKATLGKCQSRLAFIDGLPPEQIGQLTPDAFRGRYQLVQDNLSVLALSNGGTFLAENRPMRKGADAGPITVRLPSLGLAGIELACCPIDEIPALLGRITAFAALNPQDSIIVTNFITSQIREVM